MKTLGEIKGILTGKISQVLENYGEHDINIESQSGKGYLKLVIDPATHIHQVFQAIMPILVGLKFEEHISWYKVTILPGFLKVSLWQCSSNLNTK